MRDMNKNSHVLESYILINIELMLLVGTTTKRKIPKKEATQMSKMSCMQITISLKIIALSTSNGKWFVVKTHQKLE